MDKEYMQQKVEEAEYNVWESRVTQKDKIHVGLKIGIIGVLVGIPMLFGASLLLAVLISVLAAKEIALGIVISVASSVIVLMACGICWVKDKIVSKTMNSSINIIKERCKDEMVICGIKELAHALKRECIYLIDSLCDAGKDRKKDDMIDRILLIEIKESIKDISWLKDEIVKKYETLSDPIRKKMCIMEELRGCNIDKDFYIVENSIHCLEIIKIVCKHVERYLTDSVKVDEVKEIDEGNQGDKSCALEESKNVKKIIPQKEVNLGRGI